MVRILVQVAYWRRRRRREGGKQDRVGVESRQECGFSWRSPSAGSQGRLWSMDGTTKLAPALRQRDWPCVTPYPSVTGQGLRARQLLSTEDNTPEKGQL